MDRRTMENTRGQKSPRASSAHDLPVLDQAQAASTAAAAHDDLTAYTTIIPQPLLTRQKNGEAATVEDGEEEEEEDDEEEDGDGVEEVFEEDGVDITYPPVAIPRPKPGTSLPTWLKLILKQDFDGVVHEADILAAYHSLFTPPHISDELLVRMLGQVFTVAEPYAGEYKCWIVGLRWISASEAADLFEAGYEAADAGGRRTTTQVQRNARRVMEGLATVSGGSTVPGPHPGRGGADPGKDRSAQVTEEPPPPPRDLNAELKQLRELGLYDDIVTWLRDTIELERDSYVDCVDLEYAHKLKSFGSVHRARDAKVDRSILAKIALEVFEGAEDCDAGWPLIVRIKWREIERPVFSESVRLHEDTRQFRKSVRRASTL